MKFPTMSQLWVFMLSFLLFASQVVSSIIEERDVVGSCRYEKTSVAVFSCIQPGGKWRPPSTACCNALLYAIDQLPVSGESGACCLCRYMRAKHASPGLVMSYVLCQGKDMHIVNKWSSFPITSCVGVNGVCPRSNSSSPAQKDLPVIHAHGAGNTILIKIMWAVAAVAICVMFLLCLWYLWWVKSAADAPKSSQSGRALCLEGDPGAEPRRSSSRRASAQQRRMSSSRSSPNN